MISIDPGDSTGVAVWKDNGELVKNWKFSLEDFIDWANGIDFPVSTIVVEDFTLRRGKAVQQTGSKMKASQGIGVAKALAKRLGAKLVRQPSDRLKIAAMHAGVKVPAVSHIKDDVSAYLHGFYFFETRNILKPMLQRNGPE